MGRSHWHPAYLYVVGHGSRSHLGPDLMMTTALAWLGNQHHQQEMGGEVHQVHHGWICWWSQSRHLLNVQSHIWYGVTHSRCLLGRLDMDGPCCYSTNFHSSHCNQRLCYSWCNWHQWFFPPSQQCSWYQYGHPYHTSCLWSGEESGHTTSFWIWEECWCYPYAQQ